MWPFKRKNYFAVVTGANGITYAMGPMPRQRAEHESWAWRESIGPAVAVKRTKDTARVLRRNQSTELARLLQQVQAGGATS
jgi:hypothetical protein